jgi:anthranilate phosphoribosyltransferase
MRHAGPTRRELGVRTAFNLCGPLANPAHPRRQLVGVADPGSAERVAHVLAALEVERAFVVFGERIDELPLDGSGVIFDVTAEGVSRTTVDPADVGLPRAGTDTLAGSDPETNAGIIRAVFEGHDRGPAADVIALNAGAALVVAGKADSLRDGAEIARETISSGRAAENLERLRERDGRRMAVRAETAQPAGTS